jgi:hypothetical protein
LLCQEFLSQALVPIEELQIPSFVADSQPLVGDKLVDVEVGQFFRAASVCAAWIIVLEHSAEPCPECGIEGCPEHCKGKEGEGPD